ncbi:MAG TPA: hypothetical protein VFG68_20515 [Fimbriiglobus sp.]|nr:hypothetical protein [Fimbriiglobus sp.]
MTSTAWALAWPVWRRHRWGLTAVLASVVAAATGVTVANAVLEPTQAMSTRIIASLPLLMCACYLASVFAYGFEADVAAAGTCFPARQFTLPVRTAELAGWPILTGAAAAALLWLVVAGILFRQSDIDVPLLWPALLAAAQLVWMQALLWWPFGLPLARPLVGMLVGHLPATGVMLAQNLDAPPWVLSTYLGGALVVGAAAAYAGVIRARHGTVPSWDWVFRVGRAVSIRRRERGAFASATRAQVWFECRRRGFMLPLLVVIMLPLFLLPLFLDEHDPPRLVRSLGLALAAPVFLAGMAGAAVGKHNPWARDHYSLPSFIATRPLTTTQMVAAKLRGAERTALIAWAVAAVLIAAAVFLSGADEPLGEMGRAWLAGRPAAEVAATVAAVAAVLVLMTWRRMAENLLIGLTGREWLIKGSVFAGVFVLFGLILFGLWFLIHPEYHHYVPELLPWLLATAVGLKFAAAVAAVRGLRRKRLVADRTLATLAGVWVAVYAALFGLFARVVPGEVVATSTLAMAIVVLMPLARVSALPLALDWNRHR